MHDSTAAQPEWRTSSRLLKETTLKTVVYYSESLLPAETHAVVISSCRIHELTPRWNKRWKLLAPGPNRRRQAHLSTSPAFQQQATFCARGRHSIVFYMTSSGFPSTNLKSPARGVWGAQWVASSDPCVVPRRVQYAVSASCQLIFIVQATARRVDHRCFSQARLLGRCWLSVFEAEHRKRSVVMSVAASCAEIISTSFKTIC